MMLIIQLAESMQGTLSLQKTICNPQGEAEKLFTKKQES